MVLFSQTTKKAEGWFKKKKKENENYKGQRNRQQKLKMVSAQGT